VKQVWRELNLEQVTYRLTDAVSPIQMMERVMELEEKQKLIVITLLWLWWGKPNSFREEVVRRSAMEVAYITALQADKFQKTDRERVVPEISQSLRWSKPPEGVLKINSDGAFNCKENSGGGGGGGVFL